MLLNFWRDKFRNNLVLKPMHNQLPPQFSERTDLEQFFWSLWKWRLRLLEKKIIISWVHTSCMWLMKHCNRECIEFPEHLDSQFHRKYILSPDQYINFNESCKVCSSTKPLFLHVRGSFFILRLHAGRTIRKRKNVLTNSRWVRLYLETHV